MDGRLRPGSARSRQHLFGAAPDAGRVCHGSSDDDRSAIRFPEWRGHCGLCTTPFTAVLIIHGCPALATAIILFGLGAVMPRRISIEQEKPGLHCVGHGEKTDDPNTN